MRLRVWFAVILVPLVAFICGNRRPFVYNNLCEPIDVQVTWEDGSLYSFLLPPGASGYLSDPPRYPKKVAITLPSGEIQTFTDANAPELIAGEVNGPIVGWRVTESGVVALLEEEIADLSHRRTSDCSGRGSPSSKSEPYETFEPSSDSVLLRWDWPRR